MRVVARIPARTVALESEVRAGFRSVRRLFRDGGACVYCDAHRDLSSLPSWLPRDVQKKKGMANR